MATTKEIKNAFKIYSENHTQINSFHEGELSDLNTNDYTFPILYSVPNGVSSKSNLKTFSYDIYFLDLIEQDKSNDEDVKNNTQIISNDFLSYFFNDYNVFNFQLDDDSIDGEVLTGTSDHLLSGWKYKINISSIPQFGCSTSPFNNLPISGPTIILKDAQQTNVVIGDGAMKNLTENDNRNVAIGNNSLIGSLSEEQNCNIGIGQDTGGDSVGDKNVYIGCSSGNISGQTLKNNSIHIGAFSGNKESESNKLIIDSLDRNSEDALIYGEIDEDKSKQKIILGGGGETEISDSLTLNGVINDSNGTSGETGQVLSPSESGVTWIDIESGSNDYINLNPVPEDFGGVEAGRIFEEGTSVQQVLTDLMYPFQTPAFSTFTISSLGGTYDIGSSVVAGSLLSNWSTTNSTNIKPNTVEISGYNLTTVSGLPNDGSETIDIIPFVGTTTKTWTITAENTHDVSFSRNLSMYFKNKRYWGSSSYSLSSFIGLTDSEKNSEILGLTGASVGTGSEFATSRVKTYNGINGGGEYLMFAFPLSFGTPSFTVNGLPNSAFTKHEYSFTNNVGYVVTYQVWFSNTAQAGALALFAIK